MIVILIVIALLLLPVGATERQIGPKTQPEGGLTTTLGGLRLGARLKSVWGQLNAYELPVLAHHHFTPFWPPILAYVSAKRRRLCTVQVPGT